MCISHFVVQQKLHNIVNQLYFSIEKARSIFLSNDSVRF